jgi:two-component system sensor histidine kinase/response regulator
MERAAAPPKILVVDDNADNRALARATLDDEGHTVILAESGEQALRAFETDAPDCVLLDVRMPGMDGFEVCRRIRALPGGEHTPIVFLTALRDVDTFDTALRAGADDFLTKPVRPTELVVRVHAALRLQRMSAELREHYDLVRHQRDDLMRLQLQKERLTEFIVHDLKNPVGTMDLYAQLMLQYPELSDRAREGAQAIRSEARSLLRMLLDLLDLSKSEEGGLVPNRRDVDLAPMVEEVTQALALKASTGEVTFALAIEVATVNADPDLLRRVLENLLDNALRYAPRRTAIRVAAKAVERAVNIEIADAGPGIPPDMREKIFDRFVQLQSGDRVVSRTGRGLGLTFCKVAVEAHGGRIWIEDAQPGTVFRVRLPI